LKQYFQMRKMMKSMSQQLLGRGLSRLKMPAGSGVVTS
jgi:hypothetical protein